MKSILSTFYYNKKSVWYGIATFVITMALSVFGIIKAINNPVTNNLTEKLILFIIAVIFPFLNSVFMIFRIRLEHKFKKIFDILVFVFMPFLTLIMSEVLNACFRNAPKFYIISFGYALIITFQVFFYAIFGSFKISSLLINIVVFLLSVINYYILRFRGTPFLPNDFFVAKTATKVVHAYDFSLDIRLICSILILFFIVMFCIRLDTPKIKLIYQVLVRVTAGIITASLLIASLTTDFLVNIGFKPEFFNKNGAIEKNGFFLNFFSDIRYMHMSEPNNYDEKEINGFVYELLDEVNDSSNNKSTPNIICIMNESLADLGEAYGTFETNKDYMPFIRSLTENTIKGNLYVPTYGGGTGNVEFEFLTGHSMAFLPPGSSPYVSYIKSSLGSMVSTLEAQGYATKTFHPYYSSGYNRTEAYKNMGFDKFISIENMLDSKFYDFYKTNEINTKALVKYMDKEFGESSNILLRNYISDSYSYKWIIKDYEMRDKTKPYFMFNITMQNHSGYTPVVNMNRDVKLTSIEGDFGITSTYLSLIKESDKAFEEIINYFSTVEEPTIICMFGDHQPRLEDGFIDVLSSKYSSEYNRFQQAQNKYCTPFVIWANYDIEEQNIDKLSVNYLSSLVMDIANVEMPAYNKYLLELLKELPVINVAGYCDSEGNYYSWEDESPYEDLLNNYEKIQYNNLFDQENVDKEVFYINGYVPEVTDLTD